MHKPPAEKAQKTLRSPLWKKSEDLWSRRWEASWRHSLLWGAESYASGERGGVVAREVHLARGLLDDAAGCRPGSSYLRAPGGLRMWRVVRGCRINPVRARVDDAPHAPALASLRALFVAVHERVVARAGTTSDAGREASENECKCGSRKHGVTAAEDVGRVASQYVENVAFISWRMRAPVRGSSARPGVRSIEAPCHRRGRSRSRCSSGSPSQGP